MTSSACRFVPYLPPATSLPLKTKERLRDKESTSVIVQPKQEEASFSPVTDLQVTEEQLWKLYTDEEKGEEGERCEEQRERTDGVHWTLCCLFPW